MDDLVEVFWQSRLRGAYFPKAYFGKLSIEDAYRVQLGMIARREAAGEKQIGWKVGLTAPAIQAQFGFHEPVFGCVLDTVGSGTVLSAASLIAPGFENELCMKLGRDLTGDVSVAAAASAVEVVYPALEIIETRGPFTEQIALALADNAQQKVCVLGDAVKLPADLTRVQANVFVNGVEVGAGTGDAVLGNPLNSLVWLAGKLGQFGRGLKAGDIVMTGSFTRQFPLAAGDKVRSVFAGVGAVEVAVA
jgi:2-keto-4-pentenoate hydratase